MAKRPRSYGTGPYGLGLYERYPDVTTDVAGAASIRFAATAAITRVVLLAGASGIRFGASGVIGVEHELAGATSIAFDARAVGASLVFRPQAITSITFTAWAHSLAFTWVPSDTCEAGSWDAAPCGEGAWTPLPPCEPGAWPDAPPAGSGTWTPLPPCEPGSWSPLHP